MQVYLFACDETRVVQNPKTDFEVKMWLLSLSV